MRLRVVETGNGVHLGNEGQHSVNQLLWDDVNNVEQAIFAFVSIALASTEVNHLACLVRST